MTQYEQRSKTCSDWTSNQDSSQNKNETEHHHMHGLFDINFCPGKNVLLHYVDVGCSKIDHEIGKSREVIPHEYLDVNLSFNEFLKNSNKSADFPDQIFDNFDFECNSCSTGSFKIYDLYNNYHGSIDDHHEIISDIENKVITIIYSKTDDGFEYKEAEDSEMQSV